MYLQMFMFLGTIIYLGYLYVTRKFNYWNARGIKGPKPLPIVGNFGSVVLVKKTASMLLKEIYSQFPDEKVVGIYRGSKPALLIRDPELVKQVLIKDFNIFQDRGLKSSERRFSENLFAAEGETWKILRQKLTPMFTSGKLKNMMPLLQKCVDEYVAYINKLVDSDTNHEIRSLKAKFTLEVIGSCAFGLNLGAISDDENEFGKIAKKIFTPTPKARCLMALDILLPGLRKAFPNITNTGAVLEDFFVNLVKQIISERNGKPSLRKDFMDLMIELREQGKISRRKENGQSEIEIDDELIAAQALIFYAAGFETSSATMSFLVHELALHQDIQERAYQEVNKVYEKYEGKLSYEALSEMTYLEMVFDATLRKYPVASALVRKALANYTFPNTDISVEKGAFLFVSVYGLHHDPKYFDNPEEFNPEIFAPEAKKNILPYVYLPFGDGPRNCIGMRFAKVQSLMGMAAFLKNFRVEPSSQTMKTLTFDPKGVTLTSNNGIWVKILKR
uniref:unspecific monooxygenase n=1 Tax=Zygaena filipendulae TaxID=287375 RepID=A0A286MXM6_9NEOP|nr:cytochrome P450 CYP6CV6 [Zygaena filipendulae]